MTSPFLLIDPRTYKGEASLASLTAWLLDEAEEPTVETDSFPPDPS